MEGAVKRLPEARAFFTKQSRAAVSTAVDECFDLDFGYSGNDHGVGADVVNVMVANARNVLFTTRPLPGARPHGAHLLAEEIRAGVAAGGQVGVTQKCIGLGGQRRGRRLGIGGEYLRNGAALRARLAGF